MASPYSTRRSPGTGTIRRRRGMFIVEAPRRKGEPSTILGTFGSEFQADRALSKYLAARGGETKS